MSANAILVAGTGASDDVAGALHDFYLNIRIVSGVFVALFLGGIGVATLRSRSLPWPLPELALAIAIPIALAPLAAFQQESGLAVAVTIAYAAQTFWIFLVSMWLTVADGGARIAFIRRSAFLLLVLAAAAVGLALVVAPGATGTFFAWGLGPEPLASFAGGVYVGAATAYAFSLRHAGVQVRGFVAGALVLSGTVFVVTLTHLDQFDFDRLQAWAWVVLFAGFTLVTAGLLVFDRDEERARSAHLDGWVRGLLAGIALAGGALALALWIDPTGLAGPNPFALSPLGGRFAGSWVALLAFLCGWAAVRDRVDEARLSAAALVALPGGALVAALRSIDKLEPAGAAAVYIATLALLVAAGVVVLVAGTRNRESPHLAGSA